MIERPKRAVTRFFVPLIDVLILLFCIFLLMPFVSSPAAPAAKDQPTKAKDADLPTDVATLQRELVTARKEVERLKAGQGKLAEQISLKVIQFDPDRKAEGLYYVKDGERVYLTRDEVARNLITEHTRASGTRTPFFLFEFSRRATPSQETYRKIAEWFTGIEYQFYFQ